MSEAITDVYLFESDKERTFRMERRKFYQQNKKVVDEILKIGKDKQVQAGYSRDVYLTKELHKRIWHDVAKGRELTWVIDLHVMEDGPELFYNFAGESNHGSSVLAGTEEFSGAESLDGLVKEIKRALQSYDFYGTTSKGWFYTFNERKTLETKEEVAQALQNFAQNLRDTPQMLDYFYLTENEEQKQALVDSLNRPLPEAHDLIIRGLTPEERKEFVRIYNI